MLQCQKKCAVSLPFSLHLIWSSTTASTKEIGFKVLVHLTLITLSDFVKKQQSCNNCYSSDDLNMYKKLVYK